MKEGESSKIEGGKTQDLQDPKKKPQSPDLKSASL